MSRELLTAAAKAAGYEITWKEGFCKGGPFESAFIGDQPWNPIADDGDALRLAVKLNIDLTFYPNPQIAEPWVEAATENDASDELLQPDPFAATRRAITRAAAEIEKSM